MIYVEDWPKVRAMTSDDFRAEILYPHDLDSTGKAYGMSKMGMNSLQRGASATDPIPIEIAAQEMIPLKVNPVSKLYVANKGRALE